MISNTLAGLQNRFQAYLFENHPEMQSAVRSTAACSADMRLGIYQEAYFARLCEALSSNYPALYTYLGDREFQLLSKFYTQAYPSTFRSIRWFGGYLPQFLQQYDDAIYARLADLALFEWHMTLAFDAEDSALATVADMASVAPEDWEKVRVRFHPACQMAACAWDVVPLWEAMMMLSEPGDAVQWDLDDIVSGTSAMQYILWRDSDTHDIFFEAFDATEAFALAHMQGGGTLGTLCLGLGAWYADAEVGLQAAGFLKKWLTQGIIAEVVCDDT